MDRQLLNQLGHVLVAQLCAGFRPVGGTLLGSRRPCRRTKAALAAFGCVDADNPDPLLGAGGVAAVDGVAIDDVGDQPEVIRCDNLSFRLGLSLVLGSVSGWA
jgi:hypothetical protein